MTTDTTPWYPASWLDADGKLLPDVHEVTPGEWPPCKPYDKISFIRQGERASRSYNHGYNLAGCCDWYDIVAIYIIERAA